MIAVMVVVVMMMRQSTFLIASHGNESNEMGEIAADDDA